MDTATTTTIPPADISLPRIQELLGNARKRFQSGESRSYAWRRNKLLQLKALILQHENEIYEALHSDLHKSKEETYATEVGIMLSEINHALRHLKTWMRPKLKPAIKYLQVNVVPAIN